MKNVSRLSVLFFLFISVQLFGQTASEKLRNEENRLAKKIATTKKLLDKTKTITSASYNELLLIDKQIQNRQELVTNFDNQVRGAEIKVAEKSNEVVALQQKLIRLKAQYKKLVIYSYKHRNRFGKMMFIFSANSYNEAVKRGSYLKYISDIQKKQFLIIRQHEGLIKKEIVTIEEERLYKLKLLEEKKQEKFAIEKDKQKQEKVYSKLKQEEQQLVSQLRNDENKKAVLKDKINAAIKREIAAAEEKQRKAEEKRRKAEEAARNKELAKTQTAKENSKVANSENKATSSGSNTKAIKETPKETPKIVYTESKESMALSHSFEGNKGRLPWPVASGSISEGFGKNAHATLNNVYTNNNGIDISTSRNAQVRSVFEGEVTSVFSIPGAGKVVIIKHGNYRTVYSNLQEVYVSTGSKVSTKQSIGSLIVPEGSSLSIAHFEIHTVAGGAVKCLNPSSWVSR